MADIILERSFDPAIDEVMVYAEVRKGVHCLDLHRMRWNASFLDRDGARMICWFNAADTESARIAFRQAGVDQRVVWRASVHEAADALPAHSCAANVLVTRRFDAPVAIQDIQAIENAGAWCLENHRVRFARRFFSNDQKRMICLYRAPDAESVRRAQQQAGMPVEHVWAFQTLGPERMPQ